MEKIPIKCPTCGTLFTVTIDDIKEGKIQCPKCKTPLELMAFPTVKSPQDIYYISLVQTLYNINRLYDVLIKKLEKVI